MHSILTEFSAASFAGANEANLCGVYRLLGRSPQARVQDEPDLLRIESAVPNSMLNRVLLARFPAEECDSRTAGIIDHYRRRTIPWVWEVGPGSQSSSMEAALSAGGLTLRYTTPGLAIDLARLPDAPVSTPKQWVQEVLDAQAMDQWAEVASVGFGLPRQVVDVMVESMTEFGYGEQTPMRSFVAYQDEQPVACSSLYPGAGVAGIYCVTTMPGARKQGLGALVTAHPLRIARALGYRVGVLQASRMGLSIYQRLGFEECCQFVTYA